ncbi:helix-turn-helix transcriptional regulator [Ruegeria arenilitoris]|uniref:helix-turn-helix transcriptional regulator n=1 Tax=Ruegeria arenilitoris TaxID=1173585 RepID=UPI001480B8EA|nr:AraC family transcriptional regulator [Ruegeria arenilitoris]
MVHARYVAQLKFAHLVVDSAFMLNASVISRQVSQELDLSLPPMIAAKALGPMPDFVLEQFGARTLGKALAASALTQELIDHKKGYLPEVSFANFVARICQEVGGKNVGLMWAPNLTVRDYGLWGEYVLSAPTLGQALQRAGSIMPLHSSADRTTLRYNGNLACYGYRFGLRQHHVYPEIAYSALGSMLSIFRHYLGRKWTPSAIKCDFPKPRVADDAEITFGCQVSWNTGRLEICFPKVDMATSSGPCPGKPITVYDLHREIAPIAPKSYADVVIAVLRQHLDSQKVSLDRTALALDIGPRTLQRRLLAEGESFRSVVNRAKVDRAKEILATKQFTVQEAAFELGYENPQNFSRAFKNQTGITPSQYSRVKGN